MTGLHGKKRVFVCVLLAGLFVLISVCSIVYACTVTSVSLSVSDESEEDAENNPDVDSTVIPIGNTVYVCAVCELENPNNEGVDWQFDLDGDGSYETTATTDYDSEDEYLSTTQESGSFGDSGEFTIRVQARLDDGEDTWEGPATCDVTVVKVDHVTGTPTVDAVGEDITFTAYPDPTGKSLDAIEWQRRSKAESGDPWGNWIDMPGSSATHVFNITIPEYYQFQARNGEHDAWQPSQTIVLVKISGMTVGNSAGVNNTVLGHVSCTIEPTDRTVTWSIEEPDLGCDIAEDGVNTTAKITPATTGGTITVIATASGVSSGYNKDIPLDVVKISNMTFTPPAIAAFGLGTDETVASVTVVPSGRTMSWEILADDLGCNIYPVTSTTADVDAGNEGGTVTVRAKDSEIEGCYLDDTLTVVSVELTDVPDLDEVCLLYTGSYPDIHPDEGEDLHGTEPTHTFTAGGTPSGGEYLWEVEDRAGCGMLEILYGEAASTVTLGGERASPETSEQGDAWFSVSYTLNGCTAKANHGWTVSKPTTIAAQEGAEEQEPMYLTQWSYFKIKDQFGKDIEVAGIVCWEDLTRVYGHLSSEGYMSTQDYEDDDGEYKGGIVARDHLQIGRLLPDSRTHQTIYIGGWQVSPMYILDLYYHSYPNGLSRTATSSPP